MFINSAHSLWEDYANMDGKGCFDPKQSMNFRVQNRSKCLLEM